MEKKLKEQNKRLETFFGKWHFNSFDDFEKHYNFLMSLKNREYLQRENETLKETLAIVLTQKKEVSKNNERLKTLLNNVCAYLCELASHDKDFFTEKHSKLFFDMTKEEHKKYILGEDK